MKAKVTCRKCGGSGVVTVYRWGYGANPTEKCGCVKAKKEGR